MKLKTIALILITAIFYNCKCAKVDSEEKKITVNSKEITEKTLSPKKDKVLILRYVDNTSLPINFNYSVLNVNTNHEILKGVFQGLKIEWLDNNNLKGYLYKGIIEDENSNSNKSSDSFKIIKIE